jgi:two-component system, sensor histidine kinase and response regulator
MRPLRILVVEDNPPDAAMIRAMLDPGEFEVVVANRIDEAIASIEKQRFDAALLDLSLPDVHGIEALHRLQDASPSLPVVIVSGDGDERVATAAVAAGAQDYLLKGHFTDASLRRQLRYAIERQELTDRLAASIDELERQRASVLQLNQLKNDLIAVLAHDIKGPLTSIVGFAELLEEGYLEGTQATDAAHTIRMNAQRLATLANDVLELSRIEHGELEISDERVNVVDLVEGVAEAHRVERSIAVKSTVSAAFVRGDEDRLRQVFDNLFRNAIKYSPQDQPIDVTIDAVGENFRFTISDRGMGIPPEDLPRLFERFSRASNARRAKIAGTGIGLFIVKMIAERHGGAIEVESILGEGSAFTLTLPSIDATISKRPMRVTILTTDSGLSRFAAYELRSRGYRVREAASLDDLSRVGDIRPGDVVLVDSAIADSDDVRKIAPKESSRLVGIGGTNGDHWDATLSRPFLVTDLLAAVEG